MARGMQRKPLELTAHVFDVLVIGGGIAGCTLARELALRGLHVALIDRSDFGAATTANSLRILHGGLRYLQSFDLVRTRASAAEQAVWARIAPHLVEPLPCCALLPPGHTFGHVAAAVALAAYEQLTRGLRFGALPPPRIVNPRELSDLTGLQGGRIHRHGLLWHELLVPRPPRLVLALVRSAVQAGAVACTYVEATGLLLRGAQVRGVTARDNLTDGALSIRARIVVDATGPWATRLLEHPHRRPYPVIAWNVVLDTSLPPCALGLPAKLRENGRLRSRTLFITPCPRGAVLGTLYARAPFDAPPTPHVRHARQALAALRAAALRLPVCNPWRPRFVQIGLLPADPHHPHQPAVRPTMIDHRRCGGPDGLFSLSIEKLTTARLAAERLARRIAGRLGHARRGNGADTPIEGVVPDVDAFVRRLEHTASPLACRHLRRWVRTYGTHAAELVARPYPEHRPLSTATEITEAEIDYAARCEMAATLADVAFRRTTLAAWETPDAAALRRAAAIMARHLGWSDRRQAAEVALVQAECAARRGGDTLTTGR